MFSWLHMRTERNRFEHLPAFNNIQIDSYLISISFDFRENLRPHFFRGALAGAAASGKMDDEVLDLKCGRFCC